MDFYLISGADGLAIRKGYHRLQEQARYSVEDMRRFLLTKAQVDVNQRAYDWACDWVASNQAHFGSGVTGELYGEISGEYAYIIPSVFRKGSMKVLVDGIYRVARNFDSAWRWKKSAGKT